jgi:hypothetical protein
MSLDIFVPISVGELLDKISILQIKQNSILDAVKLVNVSNELRILMEIMERAGVTKHQEFDDLFQIMFEINRRGWDYEDQIRELMVRPGSDQEFIDLAVTLHKNNDSRMAHKKRINLTFNSNIIEEKSYKDAP